LSINWEYTYDIQEYYCYSLKKQQYNNTTHEFIGLPERLAVCPGEFSKVETFAPLLLPEFQKIWTPEVIKAWQDNQPKPEPYIPPEPEPPVLSNAEITQILNILLGGDLLD